MNVTALSALLNPVLAGHGLELDALVVVRHRKNLQAAVTRYLADDRRATWDGHVVEIVDATVDGVFPEFYDMTTFAGAPAMLP